jgi:hypothetical protein
MRPLSTLWLGSVQFEPRSRGWASAETRGSPTATTIMPGLTYTCRKTSASWRSRTRAPGTSTSVREMRKKDLAPRTVRNISSVDG